MSITITVASGKGGTGKTTVSTNLAAVAPHGTALLDCDVEEPNAHLFLPRRETVESRFAVRIPAFDAGKCDSCGLCAAACRFNAICNVPKSTPMLFAELCHSCGVCLRACPKGAIHETDAEIGTWNGLPVVDGLIDVGQARSAPLIEAVRKTAPEADLRIVDAPAGTSCPVVAACRGVDYIVMVAEPTPFGLHDLRMAVGMAGGLGVPFGVVMNRSDIGDGAVGDFCRSRNIPVLAELPFDRRAAEAYSRGELLVDISADYRRKFCDLLDAVLQRVN